LNAKYLGFTRITLQNKNKIIVRMVSGRCARSPVRLGFTSCVKPGSSCMDQHANTACKNTCQSLATTDCEKYSRGGRTVAMSLLDIAMHYLVCVEHVKF